MSRPKNSLYSMIWQNLWPGGIVSSPHGPETSPAQKLPGFGEELIGFLFFTIVTGNVDVTISVKTTPNDPFVFSELFSVTFKPAVGNYHFRLFADAMPKNHAWARFDLSSANGTSVVMSSMMIISQLKFQPSGHPDRPGGIHYNGYGSGLLESDANGQARGVFDIQTSEDL